MKRRAGERTRSTPPANHWSILGGQILPSRRKRRNKSSSVEVTPIAIVSVDTTVLPNNINSINSVLIRLRK
ncbi:unnamed protein product [Calypogeia fissa]